MLVYLSTRRYSLLPPYAHEPSVFDMVKYFYSVLCMKEFAHSVQMLTSVPQIMVAVDTHVPTPLAPTTAPVILGTDWVTTGTDVTVSEWNLLCLSSEHSVVSCNCPVGVHCSWCRIGCKFFTSWSVLYVVSM